MSDWDWSKEEDDVVGVLTHEGMPDDIIVKRDFGELVIMCRKLGKKSELRAKKLSFYAKEYGNKLHIRPEQPEWTIHNNDKPFGELSDEQKGKLMVASLSCAICTSVNGDLKSVEKPSWHKDVTYRAKQPEPSMTDKDEAKDPKSMCINCEETEVSNNLCKCCDWLQKENKYSFEELSK